VSSDIVGVEGISHDFNGIAVRGHATQLFGTNYAVYGECASGNGFDFYAAGAGTNYGAASSRRWKTNIINIPEPLEKLAQLRGVYYDWDKEHGGRHDIGMIAEEVGEVLPEIVAYEENGIDAIGLDYSMLSPLLVEAVNALRVEKDAEIAELRDENDALRERLEHIERMLQSGAVK
jgi:hypothetical protein